MTNAGDRIRGQTYSPFMPLIAVALIYLVMVVFFTWLVGKLERRLQNTGARAVKPKARMAWGGESVSAFGAVKETQSKEGKGNA